MQRTNIFIILIFIFFTLSGFAQPESRPRTEELKKLNVFAGKWKAEGKLYPGKGIPAKKIKGEPTFEWVMYGTWLMFKSGGGRIAGHGYLTWDEQLGKYSFFWFDNLITRPTGYHGNWLDSKTLILKGKLDYKGNIVYTKLKWKFINENEIMVIREVSLDGKKFRTAAEWKYTQAQ